METVQVNVTIAEELITKLEEAAKQVEFVQVKLLEAGEGIRRAKVVLNKGEFINATELERWLNYADDALKAVLPEKPKENAAPSLDPKRLIEIYTDGGCNTISSYGGYGFVITQNGEAKITGHNPRQIANTTNQRMEVRAAIEALKALPKATYERVHILSDSEYLVKTMNNEYSIKANVVQVWDDLTNVLEQISIQSLIWEWIPKDSHPFNKQAHDLSKQVR